MRDDTPSFIPGQAVLPGFEDVLGIESARLKNPKQERFCWEFVTNGGKTGQAYQVAINPDSDLLNAQKRASDLLKNPEISGRVREIAAIIQRKYEREVIASAVRALTFDPASCFKGDGAVRRVHEMEERERIGIGLESRLVDGCLHYVPVFPSPEKARADLAKMFGMFKDRGEIKAELVGRGGGPIQTESAVKIYIPDNGRD
jgi:hypothetical protein